MDWLGLLSVQGTLKTLLEHHSSKGASGKKKKKTRLPMQETQVPSLGQEDPLEKGMATHSSILGWRIPKDRGAWRAIVHGVAKSRTLLSTAHTHFLL